MTNGEIPYDLQRWNERDKTLRCPGCGRSRGCYKEYVWRESREPIDPINHLCGKCDHENSCGYHLTPKEFGVKSNDRPQTFIIKTRPQMKMITLDKKLVADTMQAYDQNTFVCWLQSLPLTKDMREQLPRLLFYYCVGTTRDRGTIWWQVDEQGRVRAGKIMRYLENGHRDKSNFGTWVHAKMKPCPTGPRICRECKRRQECAFPEDEYKLEQCLFGQHLLCKVTEKCTIHIVESEKAAFIMALNDPQFLRKNLWMACGGLKCLRPDLLENLKKHKVILYPDTNGIDQWKERAKGFDHVTVSTKWMQNLTDEDPQGAGIDDIVLRRMMQTPEAAFDELCRQYEPIKNLRDILNLRPIEE